MSEDFGPARDCADDAAARDDALAGWLHAHRPVPAADFRGRLGRRLRAADPGYRPRPENLRRTASLYLLSGGALLAAGLLQALGVL
jgi:hypothetical protein